MAIGGGASLLEDVLRALDQKSLTIATLALIRQDVSTFPFAVDSQCPLNQPVGSAHS